MVRETRPRRARERARAHQDGQPARAGRLLTALGTAAVSAQPSLTAEGTEFVLATADGRTLRGTALQGATLRIELDGRAADVTIERVKDDPRAVGGRVLLHRFVVRESGGRSTELCAPDAEGRSRGFPVPDGRGGFDLTCTSGAVGKCITCHGAGQPAGRLASPTGVIRLYRAGRPGWRNS